MFTENLSLKGKLLLELFGPDGELKEALAIPNLIVQTGKNFVATALIGAAPAFFSNMAVGTGSNAPTLADTTLQAETGRTPFTSASAALNVATIVATFAAGVASGVLQEAGLFNGIAAGLMFSRVTFGALTKSSGDSLVVTWTITAG